MGKKILLADDSITIQKVIELTFSDEDFEVVTVGNGRLAVERLEEVRPDIVLCDIIMPEKDGYEVCDYIKKHSGLGHVPVLLLTGAFEPFDQERAARVGCDGFLAKPFEPQSLISKVKDLLNQAASRPRPITVPPPVTPISRPTPVPAISPAFADATAVTMPSMPMPILQPAPAAYVPPEPDDEPLPLPATPEPPGVYGEEALPEPVVGTYSQPMELTPEPGTPPPPYAHTELSEDLGTEEPVVASQDELMPLMSEEAASLVTPPVAPEPEYEALEAPDDGARTVIFKAGSAPPAWSEPATVEVPLETRAQATIAAATEPPRPVFEPVSPPPPVEEPAIEPEPEMEIESSFEPDFGEPATTPAPPEPAAAFEPEPLSVPTPPPASAPPPPEVFAPAPPEPIAAFDPMPPPPLPEPEEVSFADVRPPEPEPPALPPSHAAEVAVPMEQVAQIAQRVVAQISERVVREVAWEVIPDLAEMLIRKEIERLRAELEKV